jgi:GNAT superfamily N-acetyltransferase
VPICGGALRTTHRQHGIGKALMEYVLNKAKSLIIALTLSYQLLVYLFFKRRGIEDTRHWDFDLPK